MNFLKKDLFFLFLISLYILIVILYPVFNLFKQTYILADGNILGYLKNVYADESVKKAFFNTVVISLGSVVVSVIIGVFFAVTVVLSSMKYKNILVFLLFVPMLVPAQITAVAWLELMGHMKNLGIVTFYHNQNPLYSKAGMMFLLGIEHVPLVFLSVKGVLRNISYDLIEAAKISGSKNRRILMEIIIPLTVPGIIIGSILAFVSSIGNFGIPALLGIPSKNIVLTTLIFQYLSSFGPTVLGDVGAVAFILIAMALSAILIQVFVLKFYKVKLVKNKSIKPVFTSVSPFFTVFVWLFVIGVSLIPLIAMVVTSLLPTVGVNFDIRHITFANYLFAFEFAPSKRGFENSLFLGISASVILAFISLIYAYLNVVRKNKIARFLNFFIEIPYALPGLVLSIAFIMAFIRPMPFLHISLYDTVWIILLAYLARFVSLALRPVYASFLQFNIQLEEAAEIFGAGMLKRIKDIILPSVLPSLVAGMVLVFMGAFNELTVSSLLWSVGNETIGVIIYNLYDEGNATGAAAIATITVVVTFALAVLLTGMFRKLPKGVLPWQE